MKPKLLIIKRILLVLIAALSAGLQYSVAHYVKITGASPNLMFVAAVVAGFTLGGEAGGLSGLCLGLYQDAQSGKILGMHALLFLYAGAVAGMLPKKLKPGAFPAALITVYVLTLIYEGAVYLFAYAMPILRSGYSPGAGFLWAAVGVIIPAAFLNTLCSIPYYFILRTGKTTNPKEAMDV